MDSFNLMNIDDHQFTMSTPIRTRTTTDYPTCIACHTPLYTRNHHPVHSGWSETPHPRGLNPSFYNADLDEITLSTHPSTAPTSFWPSFLSLSTSSSELDPHQATDVDAFRSTSVSPDDYHIPQHRLPEIPRLEAVYEHLEPFRSLEKERASTQTAFHIMLNKLEEEEKQRKRRREKEAYLQQRRLDLLNSLVREVELGRCVSPRDPDESLDQFFNSFGWRPNEVEQPRRDLLESGIALHGPPSGQPTTLNSPPPDVIFRSYGTTRTRLSASSTTRLSHWGSFSSPETTTWPPVLSSS
ncbi:hypothetical protein F5880DRAFT_440711 [Lentinula raphanica]|nr:hypothetical protein F5880DRAFT_440711 [Lentinula raphanica]